MFEILSYSLDVDVWFTFHIGTIKLLFILVFPGLFIFHVVVPESPGGLEPSF